MTTKNERRLRSFEALQIALATEDARHMPDSVELDRQVKLLELSGRTLMAALRYSENALWPVSIASPELRPAVQAMDRATAKASLAELRTNHPTLQYAHRDCETLSDHDLRCMLEDALRLTEKKE